MTHHNACYLQFNTNHLLIGWLNRVLRRFDDLPAIKQHLRKVKTIGTSAHRSPIHFYKKYFLTKIMNTEVSYLFFLNILCDDLQKST